MFDDPENGVSNARKVQGKWIGDGDDKWANNTTRRIVKFREKKALRAESSPPTSRRDRRFCSSGGTINPDNKCVYIIFQLNLFHDLAKNV